MWVFPQEGSSSLPDLAAACHDRNRVSSRGEEEAQGPDFDFTQAGRHGAQTTRAPGQSRLRSPAPRCPSEAAKIKVQQPRGSSRH